MEIIPIPTDLGKFIQNLDRSTRGKVMRIIDALEQHGHEIGMPYSRSLGGGLFELRIMGKVQVRIFYCFHQGNAYILQIFIKKTDKIPPQELELARKRMELLV